MNFNDYFIDHSGLDWPKLLTSWQWLLPPNYEVWLVNRFGDVFLILEDSSVCRLDIGMGTLEKLAENRYDFGAKIGVMETAIDWLMIPLADRLVDAGKILQAGQCYSYRLLPILGGGYGIDDFLIKDLAFNYAAFGPIHEKLKDLPDGTQIRFKITD